MVRGTVTGIQQAIEDYSFAGLRGVSNNIAMLTSMIGGPAGLAAMSALAAVNLTSMFTSMKRGAGDADALTGRVSRLLEQQQRFDESRDAAFRDIAGRDPLAVAGAGRDTRREMRDAERELRDVEAMRQKQLDATNRIREIRERENARAKAAADVSGAEFSVGFGGFDSSRSMAAIAARERLATAEKALKQSLDAASRETNGAIRSTADLDEGQRHFADAAQQSAEKAADLRIELEKLGGLSQQADNLERFPRALERLRDASFDLGGIGGADSTQQFARDFEESMNAAYQNTLKERERADEAMMAGLQEQYSNALKANEFDKAAEALKRMETSLQSQVDDAELLNQHTSQLVDAERERLTAVASVQDMASETVNALDEQLQRTQELIRAEDQRIAKLKEARQQSQEGFGGKEFDARLTLTGKEFDAQADAIRQKFDGAEESKRLAALEKRRTADERRLFDDREKLLSDRAQSELEQARQSQAAGNSALAERQFGKSRQTLEELQALQFGQVGSRGLQESRDAFGRAQKTQGAIGAAFDAELQAAEQQRQAEQAHFQTVQQQLERASELKSQVEATKFASDADHAAVAAIRAEFEHILKIKQQISGSQAAAGDALGLGGVPGRATGGPVTAGSPYLTSEQGPELFVPGASGRIFNAHDTQGLLSTVSSLIAAGEHGGRRATSIVNNTPINNPSFHFAGGASVQDLLRQSAMQAKQARIRQS